MHDLITAIKKERSVQFTILLFIILTLWWIVIFLGGTKDAPVNHIFGFIYGGFSIWGGLWGMMVAKAWGGRKSLMGKAIICVSLGLLLQAFGQYSFWFYNFFLKIEVPYPGVPDLGYFGTIPFYIYAAYLFAKASGVNVSLRSFANQIHAIVIPVIILSISYFLFLRNYDFDLSHPLDTFLNFGYPLGQAIYISIAILNYSLSRKILGGIMRSKILFLIAAFFAQFLADYIFIYFHNDYFPSSFMDYFYLVAYFLMTMGLLLLKFTAKRLSHSHA